VNGRLIDTGRRLQQNVMERNSSIGLQVNRRVYLNVRSVYLHPTVSDESFTQCPSVVFPRWLEQVRRLRKNGRCYKRQKRQRMQASEDYDGYLRD